MALWALVIIVACDLEAASKSKQPVEMMITEYFCTK